MAAVGALEEMVAPMEVYQSHHADPHSVHPAADPDPLLVKQEWASFHAGPNQWEHDLAFQHMTGSTGPDSHGNHCEEDLKRFSYNEQDPFSSKINEIA